MKKTILSLLLVLSYSSGLYAMSKNFGYYDCLFIKEEKKEWEWAYNSFDEELRSLSTNSFSVMTRAIFLDKNNDGYFGMCSKLVSFFDRNQRTEKLWAIHSWVDGKVLTSPPYLGCEFNGKLVQHDSTHFDLTGSDTYGHRLASRSYNGESFDVLYITGTRSSLSIDPTYACEKAFKEITKENLPQKLAFPRNIKFY